jgi:hypothetical protein
VFPNTALFINLKKILFKVGFGKEASRRHRLERNINRKTDTQYTPKGDICGTLQKPKTVFVLENETYQDA